MLPVGVDVDDSDDTEHELVDEEVESCKKGETELKFCFKEFVEVVAANNDKEQREYGISESSYRSRERESIFTRMIQ